MKIKLKRTKIRARTPMVSSNGFTLMESLVAMAVLGVMFVALYAGIAFCFVQVRVSRENLRATQIMVEKAEVIRLLTWDQITSNNIIPATFTAPFFSTGPSNSNPSGPIYSGTIKIRPPSAAQLGATYNSDIRVVSVDVSWVSRGMTHSRTLNTYVSRYGIQNYVIN